MCANGMGAWTSVVLALREARPSITAGALKHGYSIVFEQEGGANSAQHGRMHSLVFKAAEGLLSCVLALVGTSSRKLVHRQKLRHVLGVVKMKAGVRLDGSMLGPGDALEIRNEMI